MAIDPLENAHPDSLTPWEKGPSVTVEVSADDRVRVLVEGCIGATNLDVLADAHEAVTQALIACALEQVQLDELAAGGPPPGAAALPLGPMLASGSTLH
jgi:hypothetical protein